MASGRAIVTHERRVAICVGNSAYEAHQKLPLARGDAEAVARQLEALGYTVISGFDCNRTEMSDVFSRGFQAIEDEPTILVVYFSGHGASRNNAQYLIPTDFSGTPKDLGVLAFHLDRFLRDVASASEDTVIIVIVDACREDKENDSFGRHLSRGSRGGSQPRQFQRGFMDLEISSLESTARMTYVASACEAGSRALEPESGHGYFTAALLRNIRQPLHLPRLFEIVRAEVQHSSCGMQNPICSSGIVPTVRQDGSHEVPQILTLGYGFVDSSAADSRVPVEEVTASEQPAHREDSPMLDGSEEQDTADERERETLFRIIFVLGGALVIFELSCFFLLGVFGASLVWWAEGT